MARCWFEVVREAVIAVQGTADVAMSGELEVRPSWMNQAIAEW